VSHSSTSAAEFGAENLLRPLSQIRLGLKRREEGQISSRPAVLCDPAADQLQGWLELILGKLIDQLMEFLAHGGHRRILRLQTSVPTATAARTVPVLARAAESSRHQGPSRPRPDAGELLDQTRACLWAKVAVSPGEPLFGLVAVTSVVSDPPGVTGRPGRRQGLPTTFAARSQPSGSVQAELMCFADDTARRSNRNPKVSKSALDPTAARNASPITSWDPKRAGMEAAECP
jgi:hypothetical protein